MSDDGSSGFERHAKRAFDESVAALGGPTRSRLTEARHRALAELDSGAGRWRWSMVPAGALAAAGVVAWLTWWHTAPTTDAVQATALGDLEILLGDEDLEMLDEDLEFYGWLEEQPEFAGSADSVG